MIDPTSKDDPKFKELVKVWMLLLGQSLGVLALVGKGAKPWAGAGELSAVVGAGLVGKGTGLQLGAPACLSSLGP